MRLGKITSQNTHKRGDSWWFFDEWRALQLYMSKVKKHPIHITIITTTTYPEIQCCHYSMLQTVYSTVNCKGSVHKSSTIFHTFHWYSSLHSPPMSSFFVIPLIFFGLFLHSSTLISPSIPCSAPILLSCSLTQQQITNVFFRRSSFSFGITNKLCYATGLMLYLDWKSILRIHAQPIHLGTSQAWDSRDREGWGKGAFIYVQIYSNASYNIDFYMWNSRTLHKPNKN